MEAALAYISTGLTAAAADADTTGQAAAQAGARVAAQAAAAAAGGGGGGGGGVFQAVNWPLPTLPTEPVVQVRGRSLVKEGVGGGAGTARMQSGE